MRSNKWPKILTVKCIMWHIQVVKVSISEPNMEFSAIQKPVLKDKEISNSH